MTLQVSFQLSIFVFCVNYINQNQSSSSTTQNPKMENSNPFCYELLAIAYLLLAASVRSAPWQTLLNNTGVVAMHMVLTHRNTVVMFDQTGSGPSRYQLRRRPGGGTWCMGSPQDLRDSTCYAHSVEYDLVRNNLRALNVRTDTWCSSGSMLSNGTLVQTGGYGSGSRRVRYFQPCSNGHCDWTEGRQSLTDDRWYASNLRLPGRSERVMVLGGRNAFSYEFVPKTTPGERSFYLPLLRRTYERNEGDNNLYPMIHLSSDGNLFVFANRDSILFNYRRNVVVKSFPRIPGRGSRSHPSSGSSVILPLDHADAFAKVEVMICGGAARGAYAAARQGTFLRATATCGRMVITGDNHRWRMESMPGPRIMSNMIILPTGDVLLINGARNGCAGWNSASNPSFQPYLYSPNNSIGTRFSVLKATRIARMYHSSAVLLPDGRVLVAGSNPNNRYTFSNVPHPTELRLQAFTPAHMEERFHASRPRNLSIIYANSDEHRRNDHGIIRPHSRSINTDPSSNGVAYGREFDVRFFLSPEIPSRNNLVYTAYAPPFNTHSLSMNQRMLLLRCRNITRTKDGWRRATLEVPNSPNVAPSGYYMLSVVNNGIPSESHWIKFVYA